MINPQDFIDHLKLKDVSFYTGVPDSLLKELTSCIYDETNNLKNITAANEGNAIAIAAGYNLATGKVPVVYMQNSGLGNCINPLTSLTNKDVYSFPMLLIIGWRGEIGTLDEPQHILPGKIIEEQLKILKIPYSIMSSKVNYKEILNKSLDLTKKRHTPVAILIRKNTFSKKKKLKNNKLAIFSRREAIGIIVKNISNDDLILSTTGKASRELYEIRNNRSEINKDFLCVGSMGHLSSIALGMSQNITNQNIVCLDGDGSCIMHLGALAILGTSKIDNIKYLLLNNGAHESVGGQSTVGFKVDFTQIAKGCGFEAIYKCKNKNQLINVLKSDDYLNKKIFVEIVVEIEGREGLPRPSSSPIENKNHFVKYIKS